MPNKLRSCWRRSDKTISISRTRIGRNGRCFGSIRSLNTVHSARHIVAIAACLFLSLLIGQARPVAGCASDEDDPDCVAALDKVHARFEQDEEGHITAVTMGGPVTDGALAHLKGLPHLERLSLICASRVTDDGLAHLEELKSLTVLSFSYANITDQALVHLRGLTNLRELFVGINRAHFGSDGLVHLRGLKNLRKLIFVKTEVTQEALNQLHEYLPECKMRTSRYTPTD